jgi:hypothetical protein
MRLYSHAKGVDSFCLSREIRRVFQVAGKSRSDGGSLRGIGKKTEGCIRIRIRIGASLRLPLPVLVYNASIFIDFYSPQSASGKFSGVPGKRIERREEQCGLSPLPPSLIITTM